MKRKSLKNVKATFDDREFEDVLPVKLTPEQEDLSRTITQELIEAFKAKMEKHSKQSTDQTTEKQTAA